MVNAAVEHCFSKLLAQHVLYLDPDQVTPGMVSAMKARAKRKGLVIYARKPKGSMITTVILHDPTQEN